jgi:hypothetical protein
MDQLFCGKSFADNLPYTLFFNQMEKVGKRHRARKTISEWQIRPIRIVDVEFSGQGKGKAVQAIHQ